MRFTARKLSTSVDIVDSELDRDLSSSLPKHEKQIPAKKISRDDTFKVLAFKLNLRRYPKAKKQFDTKSQGRAK